MKEVDRLFDAGEKIIESDLICGGFKYSLKGLLLGYEKFGLSTYKTEIFEKSIEATYDFHKNGAIMNHAGQKEVSEGGMSFFSGSSQPFSLWQEVNITGICLKDDLSHFFERFDNHGIKYVLEKKQFNENCEQITLTLKSDGYIFLSMPAPYLNGCSFQVLKKGDFVSGTKIHNFKFIKCQM